MPESTQYATDPAAREDDIDQRGTDDAGGDGADADILGKAQDDLDADDLAGDTRSTGVE